MTIPHYCSSKKESNYLRLLHFARISRGNEKGPYTEKDKKTVVEALNSFSEYVNPAIRPILPLIYHNAGQAGLRDQLHSKAQTLLRENALLLVGTEMINRQWLKQAFNSFKKVKIPVILLKGAAFSGSLYPTDTPRVGVDLDLLVTEDDFEDACALLSKTMNPVLLSSERVATHDTLFERVFLPRKGTKPTVEIHRGLTNPSIFNIDEKRLWAASGQHPVYNSDLVRILSPEDTLLHLAVHAFRDLNFCTHNILDAHEVWCQWKPDPERLAECAANWGARKVLFYLLTNCKAIMETPVPDTLLDNLKPAYVINVINKKILHFVTHEDISNKMYRYRVTQLISQLSFPDHPSQGLQYQAHYIQTRIKDWILHKKDVAM